MRNKEEEEEKQQTLVAIAMCVCSDAITRKDGLTNTITIWLYVGSVK
jgi:hypothetical protein